MSSPVDTLKSMYSVKAYRRITDEAEFKKKEILEIKPYFVIIKVAAAKFRNLNPGIVSSILHWSFSSEYTRKIAIGSPMRGWRS